MSTAAAGATLDEILRVAGAPSREELAAFVRDTVVDGVLDDQSGIGGPTISYACGTWTDKAWPLRPANVDAIVGTFKGNSWALTSKTSDYMKSCLCLVFFIYQFNCFIKLLFFDLSSLYPKESRKQINAWAAKATRNLITQVFINPEDDDNDDTVHVIANNAIYFKGEWRNPFKKENTVDREFHRLDGSSVEVPFLQSWSYQCIACHSGFKVLKLPYELMNESNWKLYDSLPRFSMCVFLLDGKKGLRDIMEKIASSLPAFLHDHLPKEYVPIGQFRLPKFKLSFEREIQDDLIHLGLELPFDKKKANMGDLLHEEDTRRMRVNRVIHKAVIEMNEEGSEAAAVTVESDDDMGYSMFDDYPPPPKPVNFVADHPFAFFIIQETSGAVVFAGHVLDPSEEV
ncbi:hypothetical protein SORBI_3005G097000 [Sorghum bicolor]|uniref:Serpin domain-containing protein n=1 Tax=Sorghum bicolor TaxID=4558 RepID=A0A1B6PRB6_SORBI|nr:hypothetical protein SORBI_3005G097000 [Sorghum bicolor]